MLICIEMWLHWMNYKSLSDSFNKFLLPIFSAFCLSKYKIMISVRRKSRGKEGMVHLFWQNLHRKALYLLKVCNKRKGETPKPYLSPQQINEVPPPHSKKCQNIIEYKEKLEKFAIPHRQPDAYVLNWATNGLCHLMRKTDPLSQIANICPTKITLGKYHEGYLFSRRLSQATSLY